jgi:purine-nucleoside phosphorylase
MRAVVPFGWPRNMAVITATKSVRRWVHRRNPWRHGTARQETSIETVAARELRCTLARMPTPHISAQRGDFADCVLLPGDPLRARFIAERFFERPELVTSVRNMLGYTGTFRGRRVSVMGHGMGIPSVSIYATELVKFYGARTLIRVGSCGALRADLALRDVIIAQAAGTDSNVNRTRCLGFDFPAVADWSLVHSAVDAARSRSIATRVGMVWSSDLFYSPPSPLFDRLESLGVLAVEMEVAGLYGVASEYNASALALLTVSDHLRREESLDSIEREQSFVAMVELALDVATR